MSSRLSHLLLTVTTLVVATIVWLVPSTAGAREASFAASFAPVTVASAPPVLLLAAAAPGDRAPLCDPRGAITFAPPPQMQDVEVTLDTGLTVDDCMAAASGESRHASRGRAP